MLVSKISLLTTMISLGCLTAILPAYAQGYHYGYGTSRVVNQNNIGLHNHDASYISPGTMSDSAKGVIRGGYRPNPLLPQVNLGRTVKTAGDNMYQGGAPYLETNSLYTPKPKVVRRGSKNYNQQQPKQNVYYPGQNASSSSNYKYSTGGAMTYGEGDNYNSSGSNSNGSSNASTYSYNR